MMIIALLMVASTALIYAASALQYHGYEWADATCAYARDACASPHYVAIAAVGLIGVFFVMQTFKKAK
jgi:hypothetical protein